MMLSPLLFLLPCLSLLPLRPAEKGLEFPQYDGKDRVLDINDKNYKKALRTNSMTCLYYHGPVPDSKELQKQHQMTELVLEVKFLFQDHRQKQITGLHILSQENNLQMCLSSILSPPLPSLPSLPEVPTSTLAILS